MNRNREVFEAVGLKYERAYHKKGVCDHTIKFYNVERIDGSVYVDILYAAECIRQDLEGVGFRVLNLNEPSPRVDVEHYRKRGVEIPISIVIYFN